MKKITKRIIKMIILIVGVGMIVFFGLSIIVTLTKDIDSEVQSSVIKYEVKEKKKYVPLNLLNPEEIQYKEENTPDDQYKDSLEEAMKNPEIKIKVEEEYTRNIDKVIKEFRSKEYVSLYYISEKDDSEKAVTFAKFKIKEIDNQEKYLFLIKTTNIVTKDARYVGDTKSGIRSQLILSDTLQDLNVRPEETRFVYGVVHDKDIYGLEVEGQKPDEIIYYDMFGKDCFLWYYTNLKSDFSGDTLSYVINK